MHGQLATRTRGAARDIARPRVAVAAGRQPEPLEQTVRLIGQEGGRVSAVVGDGSVPADAARLVATAVQRHGGDGGAAA